MRNANKSKIPISAVVKKMKKVRNQRADTDQH